MFPKMQSDHAHVPSVCGNVWWANFHSMAQNINDHGCSECGGFAIQAINGLHDTVNAKLGKPMQTPEDLGATFDAMHTAVHQSGRPCSACGKQPAHTGLRAGMSQTSSLIPGLIGGFGGGIGFIVGSALAKKISRDAKRTPAPARPRRHSGLRAGMSAQPAPHLASTVLKLDVTGNGMIRERWIDPSKVESGSYRSVEQLDGHVLVLACPAGQFSGSRCSGKQVPQSRLHPRSEEARLLEEAISRQIPVQEGENIFDIQSVPTGGRDPDVAEVTELVIDMVDSGAWEVVRA